MGAGSSRGSGLRGAVQDGLVGAGSSAWSGLLGEFSVQRPPPCSCSRRQTYEVRRTPPIARTHQFTRYLRIGSLHTAVRHRMLPPAQPSHALESRRQPAPSLRPGPARIDRHTASLLNVRLVRRPA